MGSNTKAYVVSLLLLFLLYHTCVEAGILPNLVKIGRNLPKFSKEARRAKKRSDDLMEVYNSTKNAFSHPPERIKGLSLVKEYLNDHGYFPDSNNFTDYLDDQAQSSLKQYQHFFNLQVTGYPDNQTIYHMSLLRCGVPDKNLTYDPTANVSFPVGTDWFSNNGRMKNLTYAFAPANQLPKNWTKVFEDSFKRWTDAVGVVNLTETTSYDAADIKIGFYTFQNDTIWEQDLGATIIELAESVNNDTQNSGYMILVAEKYWLLPNEYINGSSWEFDEVDLETVVMHQIGHLLGLTHSSNNYSVMYPVILPELQRKVSLTEDDRDQISTIYYHRSSGGCGIIILFGSGWGLVTTTFSLGFAFMVLFI